MGKGDKKTKRGKIVIGSFGVKRAKKKPIFKTDLKPVNSVSNQEQAKEKDTKKKVTESKAKEEVVAEEKVKKTTKKTKKDAAESQAELF